MTWFSLRVDPATQRDAAMAALFAAGAQGVHEDGELLITHFPGEPEARAAATAAMTAAPLARCTVAPSDSVDWATAWRNQARVVTVGGMTIAPPWLAEGLDPARTVVIDPGMAFGTGDHASTRGAARLLQRAVAPGVVVADLGSGSAVLSIVAARLGASHVWAVDSDPAAHENAAANVERNGVDDIVHLLEGDAEVLLPLVAPVGVVVANILSSVIVSLLPDIEASLLPRGVAVLAGIAADERATVMADLRDRGWAVLAEDTEDSWWSVLVARP